MYLDNICNEIPACAPFATESVPLCGIVKENTELQQMANKKGIETEVACTLVLLSIGEY